VGALLAARSFDVAVRETAVASIFLSGVCMCVGLVGRLVTDAKRVMGDVACVGMVEGGWLVLCL
jgi:hypothetical protein